MKKSKEKVLGAPANTAHKNEVSESVMKLNENKEKENNLENDIQRSLKLLKLKRLSPEAYRKQYTKAFVAATSLLYDNLKLANVFRNLETFEGFRSDKYKLKGTETPTKTKTKILEVEYGLEYHPAWEIQQLDEDLVKKTIVEARKKSELPTLRLALKLFRKIRSAENQAQKMAQKRTNFASIHSCEALSCDGDKYNVIYANPVYESETSDKSLAISVEDMKKLAIPSADNAVLFLWTTSTDLVNSLDVLKTWGFIYREQAIWDFGKSQKKGFCFNNRHKILLVATKGDHCPKVQLQKESVLLSRSEVTEIKPNYYYQIMERMFPEGAFLDVFSAEPRNSKWTTFYQRKEKENEEC